MSEQERKLRDFGAPTPAEPAEVVDTQVMSPARPRTTEAPGFTVVDIPDSGLQFASEWRPTMATPEYIGETTMLLEYLKRLERLHKVTMPIRACGIDPILFENAEYISTEEQGQANADMHSKVFAIPPKNEGEDPAIYELINVDGQLYMSCLSECLDSAYLNSIIAEATSSVKASGKYVFQMVGFKKLTSEQDTKEGRLLNTLRLNTYEMSVLVAYMQQFPGMQVTYQTVDGKQCIRFDLG